MTVLVNGRSQSVLEGETIAALLERLDLGGRYALVERNGLPVRREDFGAVALAEGDKLVVARPVAGG